MKNKGTRLQKKKTLLKKRLTNHKIKHINGVLLSGEEYFKSMYHSLSNTGTPCSCHMCSPGKVEEKAKYRLNKFRKEDFYE